MKVRIFGPILLCVMVLAVAIGCSSGVVKAPNGMTGAEILEMSQNASVNSLQFSAISVENLMGSEMTMNMIGASDELNHEMYMSMTSPQTSDYMVQMYIVNGSLYMTNPNNSTEWIKTKLKDKIWEEENIAGRQMSLVEGFLDAKYVGKENIGGLNCYKIDVEPNWETLFNASGLNDTANISNEEMVNMIKDSACTAWITENTYYPVQIFFSMTFNVAPLGDMTMDMTMTTSNINQPVTIELPSAATNATEISYEDLVAGNY